MPALIETLSNEAHEFNFFQAVSLLEEFFASEKEVSPIDTGQIRFESDPSIGFPPNDIAAITKTGNEIRFLLSFMGLLGVSSPLPVYFSEYASKNPLNASALRDFLSIFNHRTYALFYKCWKKYHFVRNFSPTGDDTFTKQIAAIAGMQCQTESLGDRVRLLAYTGVLAGPGRGAEALGNLISDLFDGIPVVVEQFVPRWAQLRNAKPLGGGSALGISATVGTRVFDRTGKFRVLIGPLQREEFQSFLPGSARITSVKKVVDAYLADMLEYEIHVRLQSVDLVAVILGAENTRLGETSALGETRGKTDIQSIIIE